MFLILLYFLYAVIAQLVEHSHGKGKVSGSIPDNGSRIRGFDDKIGTKELNSLIFSHLCYSFIVATLAQLVEHCIRNAKARGSIPRGGSENYCLQ